MTQPLYDLTVDYVNHHGHFMVLSSPRGLKQEELSDFQLNMLAANRIPHLLELQLEAREGNVQLFYPITGKRMLSHCLRMEKLTMHRFYSLLLRIVEVLCDSKVYMLLPDKYILKEDFIYCGDGIEDVYLTYVPREHLEGKQSIAADLQQLAARWIHRVTELHGSGYQEMMSCLLEENFNLPELKQLLLKHMRQSAAVPAVDREPSEETDFTTSAPAIPERRADDHQASVSDRSAVADLLRIETGLPPETQGASLAAEIPLQPNDGTLQEGRRKRLLLVLMAVLILCFIWKLYAESIGRQMLYACAGASAVVCFAAIVLWRKMRPSRQTEPTFEREYAAQERQEGRFFDDIGLGASAGDEQQPSLPRMEPASAMNTTFLPRADATVFLGRTDVQSLMASMVPYLEYRKGAAFEKVMLNKSSFVIGRAGDGADWVLEEAGVSRLHAEIMKDGSVYSIKDIGSKNGTMLNGEILAPYKVHPLKEGDIVKIATTKLTFKMGS